MDEALLYAAAAAVVLWGTAHLVPTTKVVAGFGDISIDNRRVITMEWIAEGLTMLFVGTLITLVTVVGGPDDRASVAVYYSVAGLLAAIAVLTALTGARTPVRWFKACPLVLSGVIGLLVAGSLL